MTDLRHRCFRYIHSKDADLYLHASVRKRLNMAKLVRRKTPTDFPQSTRSNPPASITATPAGSMTTRSSVESEASCSSLPPSTGGDCLPQSPSRSALAFLSKGGKKITKLTDVDCCQYCPCAELPVVVGMLLAVLFSDTCKESSCRMQEDAARFPVWQWHQGGKIR